MHFLSTILPVALAALSTVNGAPVIKAAAGRKAIANGYVVVMKPETSSEKFETHRSWVGKTQSEFVGIAEAGVKKTYNFATGLKGYAGRFDADVIKKISEDPDVAYVEEDFVVHAYDLETQPDAPSWGLPRVSSATAGATDYIYDSTAGEGVTAYIVDTGIEVDHSDFGGRATWGTNTADSEDTDCNGHGTHVAGTVAGTEYGLAKKADLIAVKVLDCDGSGSNSGVIEGMQWAVDHATSNGDPKKSVMNMSLGGAFSQASNDAAAAVVSAGIFLAVAAGNEASDASSSSPASEPSACTIGASDSTDVIAEFSNFGELVDVFAPGVDIVSTYIGGGTESLSGTSMASPHACGLGAYLIALEGINGSAVCDRLIELANAAVTGGPSDTTDKLIFNGAS
ncbi:subtilisin-like serine protease [Onygenales sp. PD_40]|nr:subtilisin-like serine protease [Onygenales sp. PD_40]KAK2790014.1 subtilisin-like serine protease [Onygenales sp. PD_12]KAK2796476.1 subtilisin-like serine protease [Onygenales sp. PD_10]